MTFSQFWAILRARRWIAMAVFASIIVLAVAASLLWPKQYTGQATVVIDAKPDPVSVVGMGGMAVPNLVATQVDIIRSDRVALRVIRDLKLASSADIRQQWVEDTGGRGTIEQWLVALVQDKLEVRPSRDSTVVSISYTAADPKFAAGMANQFAQAYIATTLELRTNPAKQFANFFVTQTKEAREQLELAQAKLSTFQREKGLIATDERLDIESARLSELSSQLVQIQAISSDSTSRQAQAQGGSSDRIQEVLTNPLIAGLKADLTRSEARLQELNAKLGDNHPQVVEARASISELRSRIDSEIRRVSGGVAVTNTINKQREAQVRRELDDQRAKVLRTKAVRDEGQVLARDVENAQRAYDTLIARSNQISLESQSTQSFVNVLSYAEPPTDWSSPKLLLNVVLSVFIGALLAVSVVLVLELTDRRVRSVDDLVAALGMPVLGALPKPNSRRKAGSAQALLAQQRVVGIAGPNPKGA